MKKKATTDTRFFVSSAVLMVAMFAMLLLLAHVMLGMSNAHYEEVNTETAASGQCGYPIGNTTRIECALCVEINGDEITFVTEDGNLWTWYAGYAEDFSTDYYYCIFFDTLGNEDLFDDEIFKVFREIS